MENIDLDFMFEQSLFQHRLHIKKEKDDLPVPASANSQNHGSSQQPVPNKKSVSNKQSVSNSTKVRLGLYQKLDSLKKTLELNLSIRATLVEEITKLKLTYEKNQEKQTILQKILDEDSTQRATEKPPNVMRTISVFAAPYFRDVKKMVPPENEDTVLKRRNRDVNAFLKPPRPWTPKENKMLLNGMTTHALFSALIPFKRQKNYLKKKLKDKDITDADIEELTKQLDAVEMEIERVSKKPLSELLPGIDGAIDWMKISATDLQGLRNPQECEVYWNNYLDFRINKGEFTQEEDTKLYHLAEKHKEKDWDTIARLLKTNRSAIQCFERYQTRLNMNLRKKYWTEEEDKQLVSLIKEHKCGEIIPWNKICLLMEGRTRQQIINRYERTISQKFNMGPWTPEEDGILIGCAAKFKNQWNKMKDFFKRRSTYSIRERYMNALDPSIRNGGWTKEEDRLLVTMIKRYGYGKWSKICKKMPGRTDNMCLIRAMRLLNYTVKYMSEKGYGEHDPGVYDPELFTNIIRACAPERGARLKHPRSQKYREQAVRMLLKALEIVCPEFKVEPDEDLCEVDFSWLSVVALHRVSEELHKMLEERLNGEPNNYPPKLRYFKGGFRFRKVASDSEEEEFRESPEKLASHQNKHVDDALYTMIQMSGKVMQPYRSKLKPNYSKRQLAEIALYKAYLYKQFQCSALCDEDDDLENVTFGKVDYSETLQTVVSYFIQPPVYENQFIVLTPNSTTMNGMEVIEATESRLLSISECVSHSQNYLEYICDRRKSSPMCLQCLQRVKGESSSSSGPQSVISNMESKSFMIDETMLQAAYVEGGSAEKCKEECSCASLAASQASVQLLRKRFMALFLWPSLLACTSLTPEQNQMLCTERAFKNNKYDTKFASTVRIKLMGRNKPRGKKRKSPDPGREIKRRKHIKPQPAVLRRSTRTSVLNRTSFAHSKKIATDSASETPPIVSETPPIVSETPPIVSET